MKLTGDGEIWRWRNLKMEITGDGDNWSSLEMKLTITSLVTLIGDGARF